MPFVQQANYTVEKRERLRLAYDGLIQEGKYANDEFQFEDTKFKMSYAKYLLEYLDVKLPRANVIARSQVTLCDIDESPIGDEVYEGRLFGGTAFAYFCPKCWPAFGCGILGRGNGAHYKRRADGNFVKIG